MKYIITRFPEGIDAIISVGTQAQGAKMKKSNPIHFRETYELGRNYRKVKNRAKISLKGFFHYKDLFCWDDHKKRITFTSERLIPERPKGRSRVMLLFSNPHPGSILAGMFQSYKLPNAFWSNLQEAKWFTPPTQNPEVDELREIFRQVNYNSHFEYILYCYYSFPTQYPKQLPEIFGDYFYEKIKPKAKRQINNILTKEQIQAIVTFNGQIFRLMTGENVVGYTKVLTSGKTLRKETKKGIPIYLTFPTGWWGRFADSNIVRGNLKKIKSQLLRELGKKQ